jgi:putative oxidoreductase
MNKLFSPLPLWQDAGLALVRIVTGYFMIHHGAEIFNEDIMKGYYDWVKSSPFMIYTGKASELVAGLFLLPGLFTRLASLLVIGTMAYVSLFVGQGRVWYEDQHPFMFVLLGLVFLFVGGGKYSLDHLIFKKKNNRV